MESEALEILQSKDKIPYVSYRGGEVHNFWQDANHVRGILGGISNGDEIVVRVAIKPTSSMLTEVMSIDAEGNEINVRTKGRHDPCVGIRGVPVAEAMLACVLADHKLRHRGQVGGQIG